jgi:hypothetical protein
MEASAIQVLTASNVEHVETVQKKIIMAWPNLDPTMVPIDS